MGYKNTMLLMFAICLTTSSAAASRDSTLLKKVHFGYFMHNDDNPLSNQKDYKTRNRDDHGLTFQYGLALGVTLQIFKNAKTDFNYYNSSSLYTRGLGTKSEITAEHENYADYEYLLAKHPDLNGVYVNNQIAYSKSINQLDIVNRYKFFQIGFSLKSSKISSDENQTAVNVQRKFHKITKSRNYTHEAYTDSSIFGSQQFSYFSFTPLIRYESNWVDNKYMLLRNRTEVLFWFNSTSDYSIPAVSPRLSTGLMLGFGKKQSVEHRLFEMTVSILYEPLEIMQEYADPGANGYIQLGFNFLLKNPKNDDPGLYCILTPYSLYMPLQNEYDVTMNYVAPNDDKRIVEGFFNLKLVYKI